jgi:hypothetical protein
MKRVLYTYGPYTYAKENRKMIHVYYNNSTRKIMSLARYWVESYLGNIGGYVVDHINNDASDDRLENYQLLTTAQNNLGESKPIIGSVIEIQGTPKDWPLILLPKQGFITMQDRLNPKFCEDCNIKCQGRRCQNCNQIFVAKNAVKNYCACGKQIHENSKQCTDCYERPTAITWPPISEILDKLRSGNYSRLSRELGVSDNAIRKYVIKNGYDPKTLTEKETNA